MWWLLIPSAFAITRQDAVTAALEHAPSVELAEAKREEAASKLAEARGRMLPTVGLTAGAYAQTKIEVNIADKLPANPFLDPSTVDPLVVSPQFQVTAGAQVVQPLVAPQAWAGKRLAADGVTVADAELTQEESAVTRRVIEAWHASAEAHAVLDDARRAQSDAAHLVEKGEALVETGVAAPDAILPFRRAEASARAGVAVAEQAVIAADGVLELLTGLTGGADPIDPPAVAPDLSASLGSLDRPDLRAAEQRAEAAAGRVALERAALYPTVAAVGGINAVTPSPDFGEPVTWRVGISASIPVFQGGVVGARVDGAEAVAAEAAAGSRALRQGAEAEVRIAHGTLSRALAALEAQHEAVELAEQAVTAAETRLDEGGGSLLQLQQAQTEQVAAEVELTRARAGAARAADLLTLAVKGAL